MQVVKKEHGDEVESLLIPEDLKQRLRNGS
jgi:hypothetical protein